jgi:hypothetical protein
MRANNKHILVTGSHRSGTTWIGRTVSQHSAINYIQEPFNVDYPNQDVGLKLNTWFTDYQSSCQKNEIKRKFDSLLRANPLLRSLCINRNLGLHPSAPYRYFRLLYHNMIKRQFLLKDPIALMSAGWLYERYDLYVICMIRNPFGFVGSLKKAGWDF